MTERSWQHVIETSPWRSPFTLRARHAEPPPNRGSYPARRPTWLDRGLVDAIPTRSPASRALP
jgi:hypothetical protein